MFKKLIKQLLYSIVSLFFPHSCEWISYVCMDLCYLRSLDWNGLELSNNILWNLVISKALSLWFPCDWMVACQSFSSPNKYKWKLSWNINVIFCGQILMSIFWKSLKCLIPNTPLIRHLIHMPGTVAHSHIRGPSFWWSVRLGGLEPNRLNIGHQYLILQKKKNFNGTFGHNPLWRFYYWVTNLL